MDTAARRIADERGITGLETAIVLIAFVVVASVFAFVTLSVGMFSAERGKDTIFGGISKTRGSLALTGGMLATSNGTQFTGLSFGVVLAAGGDSVSLDPLATSGRTVVGYDDEGVLVNDLAYTASVIVGDADALLEQGELIELNIDLTQDPTIVIDANDKFTLEVKPASGSVLVIQRLAPPGIDDTIIDLN